MSTRALHLNSSLIALLNSPRTLRCLQCIFRASSSNIHCEISRPADLSDSDDITFANHRETMKPKKPLHILFREAVGLIERTSDTEDDGGIGTGKLDHKLKKFEQKLRILRCSGVKNVTKKTDGADFGRRCTNSLHSIFVSNRIEDGARGGDDRAGLKELSKDMVSFVKHLHGGGYFGNLNPKMYNRFDPVVFNDSNSRELIKTAVKKFGEDKQEIAKWLSGSHLKRIVFFGCPSLYKPAVLSAKRMRTFFGIPEETVCGKCAVRDLCQVRNMAGYGKGCGRTLKLLDVMQVVVSYELDCMPPSFIVPDRVLASVRHVLKEVGSLTR